MTDQDLKAIRDRLAPPGLQRATGDEDRAIEQAELDLAALLAEVGRLRSALTEAGEALDATTKHMRAAFDRATACPCHNSLRFGEAWDELMPYWSKPTPIDKALEAGKP